MSAKDCVVKMPSWELLLSSGGFFSHFSVIQLHLFCSKEKTMLYKVARDDCYRETESATKGKTSFKEKQA